MNTKILLGVLVVGAGVLVFSFGGNKEEVIQNEEATSAEVVNGVTFPDDIPESVPIYPETFLSNVREDVAEDGVRNITLSLETSDSVADINTWYRGALSQDPWVVTSDRNVGGYILLKAENENIVVFTQAASHTDRGVQVITQRIQIK
jgi:hypothetical protein